MGTYEKTPYESYKNSRISVIVFICFMIVLPYAANGESISAIKKEAAQGNPAAENNLGLAYYLGNGVPQDYKTANFWYRSSAMLGNSASEALLGYSYFYGKGFKKNYGKAAYWIKKSAHGGFIKSEYLLGVLYYYGIGVDKDMTRAKYWVKKASDKGSKSAVIFWKKHNLSAR